MPTWVYWAVVIFAADVLIVVWNHGAHRKQMPREFRKQLEIE